MVPAARPRRQAPFALTRVLSRRRRNNPLPHLYPHPLYTPRPDTGHTRSRICTLLGRQRASRFPSSLRCTRTGTGQVASPGGSVVHRKLAPLRTTVARNWECWHAVLQSLGIDAVRAAFYSFPWASDDVIHGSDSLSPALMDTSSAYTTPKRNSPWWPSR